jgi:membrane-bound lytic murein transglycosylase D
MNFLRLCLPLLLAVLAGCSGMSQKPDKVVKVPGYTDRYLAKDTSRTIDLTHPPTDVWDRIRRGFAIPNMDTELSRQWTDYYAAHPEAVQRMAERSTKYLYYIVDEINRRGLPTELALLPFVESAYNPTALSRSQASGLWQFVPATGEHYNLKQDWWRDERRDPIASTNAALDYPKTCSKCRAIGTWRWLPTIGAKARSSAPWTRPRPPASPPITCL